MSQLKLDPQELLQKAEINGTNLPNSILNRQQADRFIDLVINFTTLLKNVRVERINHPSGVINKLDLGEIVTEGASTVSTPTTDSPTESVVNYDTEKYRSAFDLATDFVEDNIQGNSVRDLILNEFTAVIANNTEYAAIQGDSSLTTGDGQSRANNLLGVNDGWNKILADNVPAAQIVDAAGAASSRKLFYAMKRTVPAKYNVSKPMYKWVVPTAVYDKWELDEGERATPAGDTARTGVVARKPMGIATEECPQMPESMTYGTAVTDASRIWLTPLKNLIWFIQRKITIEWDRVPRSDKWECTIHYRSDYQVENAAMCVIASNVSESGSDYA